MDALAELRAVIARHAKRDTRSDALPRLRFSRSTARTAPITVMAESTLAIVVQGAKRTSLGAHVFEYGAGHLVLTSVKTPLTTQVTRASAREPFLGLGLTLQPSLVASVLLEDPERRPRHTPLAIATTRASDDLLDAFRRYVGLLDAPRDIPVLAEAIEREIVWRVIQSPHGAALREIGLADSHLTRISRAISVLHTRFARPLQIAELARVAHMSPATFHRHFRKVTAMSPLQFQKRLRLQDARARLLSQGGDVSAVSFAVGYQSPSQFSREYRRAFGVPPAEEAARWR